MNRMVASTLPYLNIQLSEAHERIASKDFCGIEIYYEGKHRESVKNILDILSTGDLKPYMHAPFSDLNIASLNNVVLNESKKQIKHSIDVAREIEAEVVTVHFGRYSPLGLSYPEDSVRQNLESIKEIQRHAQRQQVEVSFENAPNGFGAMYGPLDLIEKLVENEGISITLDIGHANTWGVPAQEFMTRLNDSIAHIHLHDNNGDSDGHLSIGSGNMDFEKIVEGLNAISYKKALCLEMLYENDLFDSYERVRRKADLI